MKYLYLLSFSFVLSCQLKEKSLNPSETLDVESEKISILISKDEDKSFVKWLNNIDSSIEYIDIYNLNSLELEHHLKQAKGILIAGGNDVNACIYGKESEVERCGKFDNRRDTLELKMIDYALDNKIPLLCVCRGEQIFNVSQGGTLIIDIPTDFGTKIDHSGKITKNHSVHVNKGTLLYEISQVDSVMVNSFHHQAVDDLANNLVVGAFASDSLIESIELIDKSVHPFVLGVQWHPELLDTANALSNPIGRRFIKEALIYSEN